MLNGCNSRFLILDFNGIPGVDVWQIGNEGGFLTAPVNMTAANGNRILMAPAERADVIVDFTNVAGRVSMPSRMWDLTSHLVVASPAWTSTWPMPTSTGLVMQFKRPAGARRRCEHAATVPAVARHRAH